VALLLMTALASSPVAWAHPANSPAAFGMHVYGYTPAAHHWPWLDLAVDPAISRALIVAPRDSAKTTWLANIVLAWRIGIDPLSTNFIGSVSDTQAHERLKALKLLIEANDQWREVFPHIAPDYRRGWSGDGLHVWDTRYRYSDWMQRVARYGNVNTPTLTAGGVGSSMVIGKRLSGLALFDDLHDEKNSLTPLQRDRVWSWLMQTTIPALTKTAKAIVIGTPWNRDDTLGRLKVNPEWVYCETPAIQNGESYWPSYWPLERLLQRKREIGSAYFRAQYLLDPAGLTGEVFETGWFRFLPDRVPDLALVIVGADLAISESEQADYTAIVTCGLDPEMNLYLLDMVWGHWSMNTILQELRGAAARAQTAYGRLDVVAIEQVQFQAAVVQEMLRTTTLPAQGIVPDKDKVTRARPWAIRAEQGKVYANRTALWWPILADQLVDFPHGVKDLIDAISTVWQAVAQQGVSIEFV
jgi:predicted phage terminase large subunit-like protein